MSPLRKADSRGPSRKPDAEEKPKGPGLKDFCKNCDNRCCSLPVVLPEERKRIMKAAKIGLFRSWKLFNKRGDYYLIRGQRCPFLKEGRCSIEAARPLNCRIYPLVLSHPGRDAEWVITPECPRAEDIPPGFLEHAKKLGQPLLERHKEKGPLI
jgi:Fe-S-cluster containining protein